MRGVSEPAALTNWRAPVRDNACRDAGGLHALSTVRRWHRGSGRVAALCLTDIGCSLNRPAAHRLTAERQAVRGVQEDRVAQAAEKRAAEALLDGVDREVPQPEEDSEVEEPTYRAP